MQPRRVEFEPTPGVTLVGDEWGPASGPEVLLLGGAGQTRLAVELGPLTQARFVDVTDAGHMVAGDQNDIFSDVIVDFLTDVGQSDTGGA